MAVQYLIGGILFCNNYHYRSGSLQRVVLITVDQGENSSACWVTRQRKHFSEEVTRANFLNRMCLLSRYMKINQILKTDNDILQAGNLHSLGQFVAMSIVQGGSGFPFLAPSVYEYFVTGKCTGITVDNGDIPDHMLKYIIEKVRLVCILIMIFYLLVSRLMTRKMMMS